MEPTGSGVSAPLDPSGHFLAMLPDRVREVVGHNTRTIECAARSLLFTSGEPEIGIVTDGLVRAFMVSAQGRQVTVRYAHPGELIGNLVGSESHRAPFTLQAVRRSTVVILDVPTLLGLLQTEIGLALAVLDFASSRLELAYAALAATAFGTVRERLTGHLLQLASRDPDGRLLVATTQQFLADSVGTVREVVSRELAAMRMDGLIRTHPGGVELVEARTLETLVGRWQPANRRPAA